eukprot:152243_1
MLTLINYIIFMYTIFSMILIENTKDYIMVSVFIGTFLTLSHIFYLLFINFKTPATIHHSQLTIDIHIDPDAQVKDENYQKDILTIFASKHANTEHKWTKTISRSLTQNVSNYNVEVINIQVDDLQQSAQISVSVEWDIDQDTKENNDPKLDMEIYFKDHFKQINVRKNIQKFCQTRSLPNILIFGKYTDTEIHNYQTEKFVENNGEELKCLKQDIMDTMKPLHNMTNNDICSIIKYWFLSDIKYTA